MLKFTAIVFQDGDHKPEVLSVLHLMFTAFACRRCFSMAVVVVLLSVDLVKMSEVMAHIEARNARDAR